MNSINRRAFVCGTMAAGASAVCGALAETGYPNKPVKLIVPYPPGGTTDVVARAFADALARELGQPIVVDNRSGAGGSIGARAIAGAVADGYTIGLANTSTHGTNSAVYKSLPYDPLADFSFITNLMAVPGVIAVHPSFPAHDYASFMKLLRAASGRHSYASSGTGGANHMCMELFKYRTQTHIVHIPYRGAGPSINDVVSGQVPIIWDALPSSLPFIKSGQLVPIGVVGRSRSPQLPAVPTFVELGLKGYESELWVGIVAPAKLPQEIQARLYGAAMQALKRPEVRRRMEELGGRVVANTPEQFASAVRQDIEQWKKVARAAHIALD